MISQPQLWMHSISFNFTWSVYYPIHDFWLFYFCSHLYSCFLSSHPLLLVLSSSNSQCIILMIIHRYTATVTNTPPASPPRAPTHSHYPPLPSALKEGRRRERKEREGEKSRRETFEVAFHCSESAGRLPEMCHLCRGGIGKSRFEW